MPVTIVPDTSAPKLGWPLGASRGMKSRYTTGTTRFPPSASPASRQSQLGSSVQVAEHPSPEATFPSSQASPGNFSPSPHGDVHPFVPVQIGSARQSAPQPSPP